MITELTDLPSGVIGFEAGGKLRAEDYRDVIQDFDGVEPGALWQDVRMGVDHLGNWKRTALVTDIDWMKNMTAMFGWLTPGDVRTLALAERDAAIAWAAGSE